MIQENADKNTRRRIQRLVQNRSTKHLLPYAEVLLRRVTVERLPISKDQAQFVITSILCK